MHTAHLNANSIPLHENAKIKRNVVLNVIFWISINWIQFTESNTKNKFTISIPLLGKWNVSNIWSIWIEFIVKLAIQKRQYILSMDVFI